MLWLQVGVVQRVWGREVGVVIRKVLLVSPSKSVYAQLELSHVAPTWRRSPGVGLACYQQEKGYLLLRLASFRFPFSPP